MIFDEVNFPIAVANRDDLIGGEMEALSNGESHQSRCEGTSGSTPILVPLFCPFHLTISALRQHNAELERERAKLAQVRIQLELRLAEQQQKEQQTKMTTSRTTTL